LLIFRRLRMAFCVALWHIQRAVPSVISIRKIFPSVGKTFSNDGKIFMAYCL